MFIINKRRSFLLLIASIQFLLMFFCCVRVFAYEDTPAGLLLTSDATENGLDYIEVKQNDNIYANVVFFNGQDETQLCDFSFTLSYDSSRLSLTSITDYSSEYNIVQNSETPGVITYSGTRTGGCVDIIDYKKVFSALFNVIGSGGSYAELQLADTELNDEAPNPLGNYALIEIRAPIVEPPEIPPSTNNNRNSAGGTVVPSTTSIVEPSPQSGTVSTTASLLPETGANVSDSLKPPVLKSAFFGSKFERAGDTCRSLVLSGSAEPNSKVHIVIDQSKLEYTADANADGDWSININDFMAAGSYKVTMYSAIKDLVSHSSTGDFVFAMPCKDKVAVGTTLHTSLGERLNNISHSKTFGIIIYLLVILVILLGTFLFTKKRKIFKFRTK